MAFRKKRDDVLFRSIPPFEIRPTEAEFDILWKRISSNLWLIWDHCKVERDEAFKEYFEPLYEARRKARAMQDREAAAELDQRIKELWSTKGRMPDLVSQINALTARRASDPVFDRTPRNWVEETVKMLDGAYKSFVKLLAAGDRRAKVAGPRSEWDFVEIRGRQGFSLVKDGSQIALSCKKGYGHVFRFSIPSHQREILRTPGLVVKGFTLFRDEPDMRKDGRFWISLSCEIPKPAAKEFKAAMAAYVAVGSWAVGIVNQRRFRRKNGEYHMATVAMEEETTVKLGRPDVHWRAAIAAIEERQKKPYIKKGSRKWHKLEAAKQRAFKKLRRQQKQRDREFVARELLPRADHFVLTQLPPVRAKKGALADASRPERGGAIGPNASAQNAGPLGRLPAQLEIKAPEHGGSVRKHRIPPEKVPPGRGHENKIPMARALRDDFLRSSKKEE